LEKYGLQSHDIGTNTDRINGFHAKNLDSLRRKLLQIEGTYTKRYFKQVFQLIPEELRPETRKTFKAYDGVNNLFNLGYEVLQWKIHRALLKAKLEPYLGFLHSVQFGKPSLVCDMQELYRYLVDDYIIQFCQGLKEKDFITKTEDASKNRKGRREYLKDEFTNEIMKDYRITSKPRLKFL
jgi:CRISPR-associated protein Cas1